MVAPPMDGLTTTCCASGGRFLLFPSPSTSTSFSRKHHNLAGNNFSFSSRRRSSFLALSSPDGPSPELDKWDQMELKFGKLIGEDPNLTLAKVMGRKANPNASYLDIEKSFRKKKGKGNAAEVVEVPLDWGIKEKKPQSSSPTSLRSPKKSSDGSGLSLTRPIGKRGFREVRMEGKPTPVAPTLNGVGEKIQVGKSSDPGVMLRKPEVVQGEDLEPEKPRLSIKPNLLLKMRKRHGVEESSEVDLLKKPEIVKISVAPSGTESVSSGSDGTSGTIGFSSKDMSERRVISAVSRPIRPTADTVEASGEETSQHGDDLTGDEIEQNGIDEETSDANPSNSSSDQSPKNVSMPASLQGKPQKLDFVSKASSDPAVGKIESRNDTVPDEQLPVSSEQEELEESDWNRAEHLLRSGDREEVELISGSSRGFVVSFGSLIGFLPYRNIGAKWKFLAFESWLRKKGLDPAMYRQNLSILGSYAPQSKELSPVLNENPDLEKKDEISMTSDMKFEDIFELYDQEKAKFLSSFVGQRIKVSVVMIDRKSRKLLFSGRPKEKEEVVEKKRSLMAKLSIGDIVKCCIKKITYFGIFVEIEGVPALIHQSEVSWDAALDPSSFFKIGQIVDAKVHQLDFALERITLSLKEITPDPLNEALESVIGDRTLFDSNMEASQGDIEWADVDSLMKELEQTEGVIAVSKARFFFSPGLAPTFQVYMASMYENRYKLLARYENKVQEVIVQASLDKDQMKAAILSCTNRVV